MQYQVFFQERGKTTVATNLAVNLAQEGMNILLAGVGIRKISFSPSMGTGIGPGLTDALMGGGSRPEGIHPVSDVIIQDGKRIIPELNHLHIMTAGTASLTAPERVVSRHLKKFC